VSKRIHARENIHNLYASFSVVFSNYLIFHDYRVLLALMKSSDLGEVYSINCIYAQVVYFLLVRDLIYANTALMYLCLAYAGVASLIMLIALSEIFYIVLITEFVLMLTVFGVLLSL
jgi:hypothetical protein